MNLCIIEERLRNYFTKFKDMSEDDLQEYMSFVSEKISENLKHKKFKTQKHHIVPSSINRKHAQPLRDNENTIILTLKNHGIAHLLLHKVQPNCYMCASTLSYFKLGLLEEVDEFAEIYEKATRVLSSKTNETKLKNGFYNKLGKLNSERLKGVSNPEHSIRMKEKFKTFKMLWWNDGIHQKRSPKCPEEGWVRGRINNGNMGESVKENSRKFPKLWWNNGKKNTKTHLDPGDGWSLGRLKTKNSSKCQTDLVWWNNGSEQTRSRIYPGDGWIKGQLPGLKRGKRGSMWNNGSTQVVSKEHPGDGWVLGGLTHKQRQESQRISNETI